jgi:hypothetical protein
MLRLPSAFALLLAGCAATGPQGPVPRERGMSCPATCQTTYTQCSGSCAGSIERTAVECAMTCDRVLEECLRSCEAPPPSE